MSVPKYCLLYFPDANAVLVESSDVIRGEHRKAEYAVNSMDDLQQEEGYVEVTLPSRSRKGPAQTLAAKILLFSDVYSDLVLKKQAFKKGEWAPGQSVSKKVSQANPNKAASQKAAAKKAANVMTENLKRSLLSTRQTPATPKVNIEDSDETDIDTDIDLFENSQRWSRKRKAIIESDEESVPSIAGGTGNAQLEKGHPITYTLLDESTASAIKELPGVLTQIKDTLETMRSQSLSISPSVSSEDSQLVTVPEMIALGGSDVKVVRKLFDRVNTSRVSLFVQDLASLVFGKECLGRSTLTGKSGKEQLDPHKVSVIVDTTIQRFPGTSVSEIRSLLRRKCNNESYSKKPNE